MNKLMKKKKKGFTLIELIAVIAILAILAVVAVPRVMTYVEKSKKTAIQTEATTMYNAAEAAYNDGKLGGAIISGDTQANSASGATKANSASITKNNFDNITFDSAVTVLKNKDLINNFNPEKFNGKVKTLGELKVIMNMNVDDLNVSSDGKLLGNFTTSDGKVKYTGN